MTIRIRDLAAELGLPLDYLLKSNTGLVGLAGETPLTQQQVKDVRASSGGPFPTNIAVTEFCIGGFKAFGCEQSVSLRPITLVFGPNSSGKSSLLHSLLWAQHAHFASDFQGQQQPKVVDFTTYFGVRSAGDFQAQRTEIAGGSVDLGDFKNVAFRHHDKAAIHFGFTLHPRPLEEGVGLRRSLRVSFDIGNQDIGGSKTERQPRLTRMELSCEGVQIFRAVYRVGEDRLEVDELDINHPVWQGLISYIAGTENKDRLLVVRQVVEALLKQTPIKSTGFSLGFDEFSSHEVTTCREKLLIKSPKLRRFARKEAEWAVYDGCIADDLNSFFSATVGGVAGYLDTLHYLGPLRTYPERYFAFTAKRDHNWHAGGGECWDTLVTNEFVRESVNQFLRKQLRYEFRTRRYRAPGAASKDELFLMDLRTKTEVTYRDVGLGISQMVPVLVQSLAHNSKTLMIEQPELHIHPALQAELGDVFIESALGGPRNCFILETHSEHLILRLLRRIRQSTENAADYPKDLPRISPDDVSVIYAQPTKDGTKLIPLRITPDGDFADQWPDGFFTERGRELFT